MIILYISIFLFGAAVASFLNATLYRIDNKYKYPDIFTKNSHCEKCGKQLNWIELFPILGYILLKGKCSTCHKGISSYYPLSELFLGVTFLLIYIYSIPFTTVLVILFLFTLSYFDYIYMAVQKNLIHIFLLLCVVLFFFNLDFTNLIAPTITGLIFLLINRFKESVGLGDILVLFSIGILLSYQQFIVMFWVGVVLALLYSLLLLAITKQDIKKAKVPMLPFFTISFLLSSIYGFQLWNILLKFIGI